MFYSPILLFQISTFIPFEPVISSWLIPNMGKKKPKNFNKFKSEDTPNESNVNLPFEGEDEFDIADFIEEIDPNKIVIVVSCLPYISIF